MNGLTNEGKYHYVPYYGRLPVISKDEYLSDDWEYVGTDMDDWEHEDEYTVCYSLSKGYYACVIL